MRAIFVCICLVALVCGAYAQKKAPKVDTTASGIRVINYTNGPGPNPKPGELIKFHMKVFIGDSLMSDTRANGKPLEYKLFEENEKPTRIPAVYEASQLMAKGDTASFFQPLDSTMRMFVPERLKKEQEIRFEMRLLEILSKAQVEAKKAAEQKQMEAQEAALEAERKDSLLVKARGKNTIAPMVQKHLSDYKAKRLGKKLQKSKTGLEYVILDKGKGAPVLKGERLTTHYYGVLQSDGKKFDSSFDRGTASLFTVGKMLPGFNEGMRLLNRGGKAIVFVPSTLGYGAKGAAGIPPNADLVFYIEVK